MDESATLLNFPSILRSAFSKTPLPTISFIEKDFVVHVGQRQDLSHHEMYIDSQ